MIEPSNTEALLAEALKRAHDSWAGRSYPVGPGVSQEFARAVQDRTLLAAELERRDGDIAGLCKREEAALTRARAAEAELERLRQINSDVVDVNTEACNRADAAEAELERVRAERDGAELMLRDVRGNLQARLNRAVEALREIADWPLGYGIDTKARNRARVALAEIEESG